MRIKLQQVWWHFINRCYDKKDPAYKHYGARNIRVCRSWYEDFERFYSWALKSGYRQGLTLDRKDNNGPYKPSNCRWVTMKVQRNNTRNNVIIKIDNQTKTLAEWSAELGLTRSSVVKLSKGIPLEQHSFKRNSHLITINGVTKTLPQWARHYGISQDLVRDRIDGKGWPPLRALTKSKNGRLTTFEGKTQKLADWAREYNVSFDALRWRVESGWDLKKALTTPVKNKGVKKC